MKPAPRATNSTGARPSSRLRRPPRQMASAAAPSAIELTVLQRTQLVVGHPAMVLAVVLATLLLGASTGSALAGRCPRWREYSWVAVSSGAVIAYLLLWLAAWPAVAGLLRGQPSAVAVFGAAAATLPLAVALGFQFPLALRALGRAGQTEVALAWTLNGIATVAGAVGATTLGMTHGYGVAGGAAAVAYLVAGLIGLLLAGAVRRPYGR